MIPEIGHLLLIFATVVACAQGCLGFYAYYRGKRALCNSIANLTIIIFLAVVCSYVILTLSFLNNDFSVAYVAEHSNTALPWIYRTVAVWGAHEGSLLLWITLSTAWAAFFAWRTQNEDWDIRVLSLSTLGLVNGAFLSFIIFTSNPFLRLLPYFPNDGADLNPLLQDPGLIIHPPMLYMGYVGFSIVFACAIASLCAGRLDSRWARLARPWVLAAWLFLTLGIALGSWWAYYTLGWGGWWFWDPVENASFLPWLTGTALIHSLAVTDMRNTFKGQTVFLAVTTFCLCLLGTFLVRSGVLTSVHAFANDPSRGIFILMLLLFVMGSAWLLYAWRMHHLITKAKFSGISRESLLLLNSLLLVTACASILLGTLYPLLLEAFGGGLISVGPPYFNSVFIPLAAFNILLMGLGPSSQYKSYDLKASIKRLLPVAISCLVLAFLMPWIMLRQLDLWACFGIGLGLWVIIATLFDALSRCIRRPAAWRKLSSRYWGMVFAHVGIGLLVLGVTVVSRYDIEQDIAIAPGQQVKVGSMLVDFVGVRGVRGANFQAMEGKFAITHGDSEFILRPQKRIFNVSGMPVSNADLVPGLFYDIYIAMAEPLGDSGAWAVRVYLKPMVRFIWLGAIFMAIGAFLALRDKRYRQSKVVRRVEALQVEGV